MIEKVLFKKKTIAIIIRANFSKNGKHFFTNNNSAQQLGHFKLNKGEKIRPHWHKKWNRTVDKTMEVLIIKKGILKVNFYTKKEKYISSKILKTKDLILLMDEGHGFEAKKNLEMIEVKQGPFSIDDRIFIKE